MSLINVQNFTFSYAGGYRKIFENVSFRIITDWKLGFVGRNGKGKTTFLNALSGKLDSKGAITSNVAFTYFPFEVADKTRLSIEIMNEVCPAEDRGVGLHALRRARRRFPQGNCDKDNRNVKKERLSAVLLISFRI